MRHCDQRKLTVSCFQVLIEILVGRIYPCNIGISALLKQVIEPVVSIDTALVVISADNDMLYIIVQLQRFHHRRLINSVHGDVTVFLPVFRVKSDI